MISENEGNKKCIIGKKKFIAIIITVLIVGLLSGFGIMFYIQASSDGMTIVPKDKLDRLKYMDKKYAKAEMLYKELKSKYYKDLSDEEIMLGMYTGMYASTGDPYTSYLTAEEYEKLMVVTKGDFYGVGITMTAKDDKITIVSTIEGSPAEYAGLKTGDIILKVDGISYAGSKMDIAASKMRGELNTKVTITYSRGGVEKDVTLVRKKIVTESVYSDIIEGNIGYIRITSFENATAEDFRTELSKMEEAKVKGLVIDLRDNGGGMVDSGIAIADMILKEGNIVYLEDRKGDRTYHNSDASSTSLPYVLLVNKGSASTTEILAGAVKDNKAGAIVGTTTFGKGIVQIVEALGDGSAVRITMKQYFSPAGNVIHEKGIEPDYNVEITEDDTKDKQLEKAINILE
ncbi:MAG: S41 family peptidase [Eubacteriales bacterium]|nr:S41 family peptidase [Eubacteriales bacterium]MDD4390026.1 S41 family peptidase [Eubacteriales bacterium]